MASAKITVDAAVYEYSSMMWDKLAGLTPENVVSTLSAGKGIVPSCDTDAVKAIDELLKRVDKFVPRVRIEGEGSAKYGADCRTFISSWRRRLTNIKTSIKRKSTVVYLTDAVNKIITKPYNDEIARLRESVKFELAAEKEHKELTSDQTQRLASVKEAIARQNDLKRNAPRCTNAILTTILHESIDNISADDKKILADLNQSQIEQERIIVSKTRLLSDKQNPLSDEAKTAAQTSIDDAIRNLRTIKEQRYNTLSKYYRCLSPQTVADTLIRCAGTFWSEIPITQTFKEVEVKMSSKKKATKNAAPAGDASQGQQTVEAVKPKSRPRKKPTQAEVAEALMLFPHSVGSAQADPKLEEKIANDTVILNDYDSYVHRFVGKTLTDEYKTKIERCRKRFMTAPKPFSTFNEGETKKDVVSQQPAPPSSSTAVQKPDNMAKLMTMLNEKAMSVPYLKVNLTEEKNKEYIATFAERNDFPEIYNVLYQSTRGTVTANQIMGYIRNVVLRNITTWSNPS